MAKSKAEIENKIKRKEEEQRAKECKYVEGLKETQIEFETCMKEKSIENTDQLNKMQTYDEEIKRLNTKLVEQLE